MVNAINNSFLACGEMMQEVKCIILMRHFKPLFYKRGAWIVETNKIDKDSANEKIKRLKDALSKYKISSVRSSPTTRAINTARRLFGKKKIHIDKRLREKEKRESLQNFAKRVDSLKKTLLSEKDVTIVISHNTVMNQILAGIYGVDANKINIMFPFAEPLIIKIKDGKILYCKRIIV